MILDNKSDVPDEVIEKAFSFVVGQFGEYEMDDANNTNYDLKRLTIKVWNRKKQEKDWDGWAYWDANTIHLWLNPDFVASLERKETLLGKKWFVVYGLDGLVVAGLAHELAHVFFRDHVHPITRSVEVATARTYFKKRGPLLPVALWKAWRSKGGA